VIQLSPPLVAGQEEFDRIASVLGEVLSEAWAELEKGRGKTLAQA
jgi:adenosylmethionine-8-amino-7-oxononanoate aminotransferase